jgi:hypothetical protein
MVQIEMALHLPGTIDSSFQNVIWSLLLIFGNVDLDFLLMGIRTAMSFKLLFICVTSNQISFQSFLCTF